MRKKVLVFIDWFYPAYKAGGPIKSVYNIVQALGKSIDFLIVTSNLDSDGQPIDVITNHETTFQACNVIYLDKASLNDEVYRRIFSEYKPDIIYYNSLFSKSFTITPYKLLKKEQKVKHILAPRGMLGKEALAIKPLKKWIFLKVSKYFLFNNQLVWHASTPQEKKEIKDQYGKSTKCFVAQNLSSEIKQRSMENHQKKAGSLRLVFLSRISRKKNLRFALDLMQSISEESGLTMDIYGPQEEEKYWSACEEVINRDKRINYKRVLKPQEIGTKLQEYDFLILPSVHENYGHVIVESVLAGVPVIIGTNTPWRNLSNEGIGYDLDLKNQKEWQVKIRKLILLRKDSYESYVRSCFLFAKKNIVNEGSLRANEELFGVQN